MIHRSNVLPKLLRMSTRQTSGSYETRFSPRLERAFDLVRSLESKMPKRKNHTGRNATVKAHANGIKKAKRYPAKSLKGVGWFIHHIASSEWWPECRCVPSSWGTFDLPRSIIRSRRLSKWNTFESWRQREFEWMTDRISPVDCSTVRAGSKLLIVSDVLMLCICLACTVHRNETFIWVLAAILDAQSSRVVASMMKEWGQLN